MAALLMQPGITAGLISPVTAGPSPLTYGVGLHGLAIPAAGPLLPTHEKYLQYAQECGLLEDTGESTHASDCTDGDMHSHRSSLGIRRREDNGPSARESPSLQRKRPRTLAIPTSNDSSPARDGSAVVLGATTPSTSSAGSSQDSWDEHEFVSRRAGTVHAASSAIHWAPSEQPLLSSGCTASSSELPRLDSNSKLSVGTAVPADDGLHGSSSAVMGAALRPSDAATASPSADAINMTTSTDCSALGSFATQHLTPDNAVMLFKQAVGRAAGSSFYAHLARKAAEFVLDHFAQVRASLSFMQLVRADAEGTAMLASSMAQHLSADNRPKTYKLRWCEPSLVFALCHASLPCFLQIDHYPLACCLARAGYASAMQVQFQRLWASPAHQDVVEECVLIDCYLTFYLAVEMGHLGVAQLLLSSCRNQDIQHGMLCSRGFEALRLSIANGHAVLAEFLLNSLSEEQRCDLLMAYGITLVNAAVEPLSHPILLALLKRIRVCELRDMLPWLSRRAQLAIAVALGLAPAPGAPGAVGAIGQAEAIALERLMASLSMHAVSHVPPAAGSAPM